MSLRHIRAFDHDLDIVIEREDGKKKVTISEGDKVLITKFIKDGEIVKVNLLNGVTR